MCSARIRALHSFGGVIVAKIKPRACCSLRVDNWPKSINDTDGALVGKVLDQLDLKQRHAGGVPIVTMQRNCFKGLTTHKDLAIGAEAEQAVGLVMKEKAARATHWSTKMLAAEAGISQKVGWILCRRKKKLLLFKRLHPYRYSQFKERFSDLGGVPESRQEKVSSSIDGMCQIQALELQPIMPLRSRVPELQIYDTQCQCSMTLLAALDQAGCKEMGKRRARHPALDYIGLLRLGCKKDLKVIRSIAIVDSASSLGPGK